MNKPLCRIRDSDGSNPKEPANKGVYSQDRSKAAEGRLHRAFWRAHLQKSRARTRAGQGAPRTKDLDREDGPQSLKFASTFTLFTRMRAVQEWVVWVRGEYSISRF